MKWRKKNCTAQEFAPFKAINKMSVTVEQRKNYFERKKSSCPFGKDCNIDEAHS